MYRDMSLIICINCSSVDPGLLYLKCIKPHIIQMKVVNYLAVAAGIIIRIFFMPQGSKDEDSHPQQPEPL